MGLGGTKQRQETRGKRENAHVGCVCEETPNPIPQVKAPDNWVLWVTRGFYIPYHTCLSKNPGGNQSEVYYPHFTDEQAETQ